jgi:cell division protein FtsZ
MGAEDLAGSSSPEKLLVTSKPPRETTLPGERESGSTLSEEQCTKVKSLCEGAEAVFVVAGLGGSTGTSLSPTLARCAKETGALVLGFVTLPFECECNRRQALAREGFEELKEAADGVISLPNQKVTKLIDENTGVLECFKLANGLLADGVRGIWRLLTQPGLIQIHSADLCALVRGRHSESAFATAEAMGATRSREVLDKLLAHPLLDGGAILADSDAVLVSLMGGPDLTMTEINRVTELLNQKCERAQIIMGASIDESFRERLALTVIAARRTTDLNETGSTPRRAAGDLVSQLLPAETAPRPGSRFVAPAPSLPTERLEQIYARQGTGGSRGSKTPRLRQGHLPLEIISKGRFDKSEPTIHKGEDLDVPTYIRRGVALN